MKKAYKTNKAIPKTALITGASRGIGKAIALALGQQHYNVVINYHRQQGKAEKIAANLENQGCSALAIRADVSNRQEVAAMVAQAQAAYGKIDLLVNNAGISQSKLFTDLTEAEWDEIFAVNVKGVFNCTQEVLPQMISQKSGKVINIASVWGMVGASCEVDYSATKGAVIAFTKALAKEVGPSNIQVNCIAPGVIGTDMNRDLTAEDLACLQASTPLGVIGRVEDIAQVVVFLASDSSNFITGQVISPNGGFVI